MKWIGQYIQDFIARFRNDVYLENIADGTVANDKFLGLDANNKIVKETVTSSSGDITGVTAGTNLSGGGTSGSVTLNLQADLEVMNSIGFAGTDNKIKSTGDLTIQIDADNNGSSTFKVQNGGGFDVLSFDESGNLAIKGGITSNNGATIPNKGSAGDFAVFDSNVVKSRTGAEVKTDLSLNNVENKSSATIRGEIVDSDIPNLNASKINAGTFADAQIPNLNASKINAGTLADAQIPNLAASKITSGTFGASQIPDLNTSKLTAGTLSVDRGGTGAATLASNSILTGNGTSAVQAESGLTYDSEVLNIGDDDDGVAEIRRLRHTDDNGGDFYIRGGDATGTDKNGGPLRLYGGRGTGAGSGGAVTISTSTVGSSGSTLQSNDIVATFKTNKDTQLAGNLVFEGSTPDANETTFSITDPTADRTITVPDATGTMCVSGASGTNMVVLGSGTGYAVSPAAQTWHFGNSPYGFNHFNWKTVTASMVADGATFTLSEDYNIVGIHVPAALSKVVLKVSCRPAGASNETLKVALCSADRDAGGSNTTWTALSSNTNETTQGVMESCDVTYTGSIAESKILSIGIGIDESSVSTTNIRFTWQLIGYLT